jgi:hypothetical protein
MRHTPVLAAAAILLCCSCHNTPDPLPGFPRLVLWAWERPEHLDFVNPRSAGVAFLARTVSWRAGQISSRPRLQPLRVSPGTPLMAVVRLESYGLPLPDTRTVRAEISKAATIPGVSALQIDFDARLSERSWYRQLLEELARNLKSATPLSITALASWCDRDSWMDGLPVSDAVPMLFRMGVGEPRNTRDFRVTACRSSFGISTDEVPVDLPRGRRLFVFHPRAWDEDTYRAVVRLAAKWR